MFTSLLFNLAQELCKKKVVYYTYVEDRACCRSCTVDEVLLENCIVFVERIKITRIRSEMGFSRLTLNERKLETIFRSKQSITWGRNP